MFVIHFLLKQYYENLTIKKDMIKILCSILLCLTIQTSYSQNEGIERSIFNAQSGFFGIWINHEFRIFSEVALRTEIGLNSFFRDCSRRGCSDCDIRYGLVPVINLEPRWYYNIDKRNSKNRGLNNSANFLTLGIKYDPDWFAILKTDSARLSSQIAIVQKWGIRRNIGNSNFNYEAGIGIGFRYYVHQNDLMPEADLHLRIGYAFLNK